MICYESSVVVNAPAASVWRVLSEVEAWPNWTVTMSAVQGRDGSALKLGASFSIAQPRLRPATWIITALDPPRYFQWTSRSPGLCVLADHEVHTAGTTVCRVILRVSFTGILAPLAGRLARALTQTYLQQECAALREAVEGNAK